MGVDFNKRGELNEYLISKEDIFLAPPLTPSLISAIKLISPQYELSLNEDSRLFWQKDQNGACWGEFEALAPFLTAMPSPSKVLEIGPGMGRSLVFFTKKMGWSESILHAYEGEGSSTKYTISGPRFEDSYCGNFTSLREVLQYNSVSNVEIFDAKAVGIRSLPGPYDFLYSFYSIGFHWSLDLFIDDILTLMHDKSIAVFTVPLDFKGLPLRDDLRWKVVNWAPVWPKNSMLKLCIVFKHCLPGLIATGRNGA
jgi:hypothetical protein